MNIICFLTLRPSLLFYNFCKTLINESYEVYICIDDNSYTIPSYTINNPHESIKIIKIDNKECIDKGFKSSVLNFQNKACSRDKSIYYFCRKYDNTKKYENIWFIEEDVFIPTPTTLIDIDNKYNSGDLLCRTQSICDNNNLKGIYNLIKNKIKVNTPYIHSMICAIRVSHKWMDSINNYVNKYNELCFDEVLFPSIAKENNLTIINPEELSSIYYKKNWKTNHIKKYNIYHPIKDINTQYKYRSDLLINASKK